MEREGEGRERERGHARERESVPSIGAKKIKSLSIITADLVNFGRVQVDWHH